VGGRGVLADVHGLVGSLVARAGKPWVSVGVRPCSLCAMGPPGCTGFCFLRGCLLGEEGLFEGNVQKPCPPLETPRFAPQIAPLKTSTP
jgi:hypothetical protein